MPATEPSVPAGYYDAAHIAENAAAARLAPLAPDERAAIDALHKAEEISVVRFFHQGGRLLPQRRRRRERGAACACCPRRCRRCRCSCCSCCWPLNYCIGCIGYSERPVVDRVIVADRGTELASRKEIALQKLKSGLHETRVSRQLFSSFLLVHVHGPRP